MPTIYKNSYSQQQIPLTVVLLIQSQLISSCMGDSPPLTDIRSQFVTSLSYSSTQNQNEMSSNKSRSNSQLPKSQIKSSMSQLLLSENPLTLDEQAILSKSLNKSKRKSVAKIPQQTAITTITATAHLKS